MSSFIKLNEFTKTQEKLISLLNEVNDEIYSNDAIDFSDKRRLSSMNINIMCTIIDEVHRLYKIQLKDIN